MALDCRGWYGVALDCRGWYGVAFDCRGWYVVALDCRGLYINKFSERFCMKYAYLIISIYEFRRRRRGN